MRLKGIAILAVLLALAQAPSATVAQAGTSAGTTRQAPPLSTSSNPSPLDTANPAAKTDGEGGLHPDQPPPHITVANPAPAPVIWTLRDKISWAANLVLVILGYVGIMLAISLLRKIDRQTGYVETAAEAAAAAAQAALLNAQSIIRAERPWVLIGVEPSGSKENSFAVMATNRGRTPARITETEDQVKLVIDEKHLPAIPEYKKKMMSVQLAPIILLPGESTTLKTFCRDDARGLCDSEERFKRIETWDEKIYLYGKVIYKDLIAPDEDQTHETNWCCWYIHGQQSSGLIIAGPPEYNGHT